MITCREVQDSISLKIWFWTTSNSAYKVSMRWNKLMSANSRFQAPKALTGTGTLCALAMRTTSPTITSTSMGLPCRASRSMLGMWTLSAAIWITLVRSRVPLTAEDGRPSGLSGKPNDLPIHIQHVFKIHAVPGCKWHVPTASISSSIAVMVGMVKALIKSAVVSET